MEILYQDNEISVGTEGLVINGSKYDLREVVSVDTAGMGSQAGIDKGSSIIIGGVIVGIICIIAKFDLINIGVGLCIMGLCYFIGRALKKAGATEYRIIISMARGVTEVISSKDETRIANILATFHKLNIR